MNSDEEMLVLLYRVSQVGGLMECVARRERIE